MGNIYKRFGGWVIDLRSDLFVWARIKLTALYLLIIVSLLAIFSLVLYTNLSRHLQHDLGRGSEFFISGSEENPVDDALERLLTSIVTSDVVALMVCGGLSYWLAGYTLKPIRKALVAQTQFSAEASHELRTPLSVMRTDIEVLLKGKPQLSQEVRQVLESNLEEIRNMSTMTEELLQLSRGKGHKLEGPERLDFKELAGNVVIKLSNIARNKGVILTLGPSTDAYVFGSRQDLTRVINNLIINSLSYTKAKGSVEVKVVAQNNSAQLVVSDTGVGIPAKDLPHVFDAFYKVNRLHQFVDNVQGTGLGLALVKNIVEQHHGSVMLKSQENKGTTVVVSLPLA